MMRISNHFHSLIFVLILLSCREDENFHLNQAGNQAGNQTGNQAGNSGGDQAGNSGGNQAGNQAGNSGANQAGHNGGDQAGNIAGNRAGDPAGEIMLNPAEMSCDRALRCVEACVQGNTQTCQICQSTFDSYTYVSAYVLLECTQKERCRADDFNCVVNRCGASFQACASAQIPTADLKCADILTCQSYCQNDLECMSSCQLIATEPEQSLAQQVRDCMVQNACQSDGFEYNVSPCLANQCSTQLGACLKIPNVDICDINRSYQDGKCDECPIPDPDCAVIQDPCFVNGLYGNGVCDQCQYPDIDCMMSDPCQVNGLYNNGVCNMNCGVPDPDCANVTDQCERDGKYNNGFCDDNCPERDPDCDEQPLDEPSLDEDVIEEIDQVVDDCEAEGMYGDGSCDICIKPDPDCGGRNPCEVLEYYDDGECDICPNNSDPDCGGRDACMENDAYGDGWCDPCINHDSDCPRSP